MPQVTSSELHFVWETRMVLNQVTFIYIYIYIIYTGNNSVNDATLINYETNLISTVKQLYSMEPISATEYFFLKKVIATFYLTILRYKLTVVGYKVSIALFCFLNYTFFSPLTTGLSNSQLQVFYLTILRKKVRTVRKNVRIVREKLAFVR